MIKLTQDQLFQRWDIIPENLRDATLSEVNLDFIWKTAGAEHIPDERIYAISAVTSYVLMGFLHPEDMAEEIQERAGLAPQAARLLEEAINKRIFTPLRADIDKVYQPLSKFEIGDKPKMIQDVDTTPAPISISTSAPAPRPPVVAKPAGPSATSQTMSGPLTFGANASQVIPAAPPKPAPTEKGWSKATPSDPVVKFGAQQMPPQMSKPVAPPSFRPQQSVAAPSIGGGEFERLSQAQNVPGAIPRPLATPRPQAASASTEPAPVMLHEVSQFKTISGNSDFHISLPTQGSGMLGSAKAQPSAPRAAMIEIGKVTPPGAPSGAPKVVHYTDYAATTGRNVSEIKPGGFTSVPVPIPPPPKANPIPPPQAPVIKQPPMPGANAQIPPAPPQKVINKDYLEPGK